MSPPWPYLFQITRIFIGPYICMEISFSIILETIFIMICGFLGRMTIKLGLPNSLSRQVLHHEDWSLWSTNIWDCLKTHNTALTLLKSDSIGNGSKRKVTYFGWVRFYFIFFVEMTFFYILNICKVHTISLELRMLLGGKELDLAIQKQMQEQGGPKQVTNAKYWLLCLVLYFLGYLIPCYES